MIDKTNNHSKDSENQAPALIRSTMAVSAPTFISRILGLIRDIFQAYYLGTDKRGDAFSMAYVIPNLLRRLTGEGAMTAAFIPVFTQEKRNKKREELWKFANYFFFDMTLVLSAVVVLGIVFAPVLVRIIAYGFKDISGKWELTISLTRIMFPYILFISLAALAMAILNSFHKFFVPAFTPVLFNFSIISIAALWAKKAEEPAFVFAVGVLIGGICQLAFQVPFLWKRGMRFRFGLSFKHPAVRKVTKLLIPAFFGAGISQINFSLSRVFASSLEEGSVASLYYASRIQELTLGLFSIALSIALLPAFSEKAASHDIKGIKNTLDYSLKLIFFVTFPAMIGLFILREPIFQVLFQRGAFNTQSTVLSASCLLFLCFGLPFISGVKIIAPVFYSLKDTKTPVIVAFFVMLLYISLSFLLMKPLRVGGIALALSLSSVFNFIFLFIMLEKKIGKLEKRSLIFSFFKSALFAVGMGGAVWIFIGQFDFAGMILTKKIGVLTSAMGIGILIYVLLNLLFNHEDLRNLKVVFSRKNILKE